MILYKFIFIFLISHQRRVFSDGDFDQAVEGFIESLDNFVTTETSNILKEEISYEGRDPVEEPSAEKETVQLLGDEYEFEVTSSIWEKAVQELQKINTDILLLNVSKVTGQVTNNVIQTMHLVVAHKECSQESCHYSCMIKLHLLEKDDPVQNTCAVNLDKREKRNTKTPMKKQVDPEEALILANFAVSTLDKFDVDNNKRVVKQILSAEKKLSEGILYDLEMRIAVTNCEEGSTSESCIGIIEGPENLCKVKLYRSFENNSPYKLTQSDCTPISVAKIKSIESLVGGWKTMDVNDPFIKEVTNFSMKSVSDSFSAPNVKLVEILSAKTQVVSGQNVKLKLKVKDDDKGIFICDLIIYDQSWTKIREVTKIECNPGDNNRKKRGLVGGWKTVNVTDPFIKNVTSFSMKSVGESISAPNVKLVEIKSAETQVVSGQNVKLKLKVKDDDKGIFICDLIIYDQSWTKIREVTKIECNPGDNNRKKRGLVGGWKTVNVTDPFIKNVTSFSMKSVGESISAPNVKLVEIKSAETQIVSGQNIKLKLKVKDDDKGIFICDLIIYDQSWTKIREVTKIECNPGDNNRKKRGLVGGWKTVNVTDPFIKNVTSFSMKSVGESISAPNVKLVEIKSAETQIVSGQNIKLKLKVKDDDKGIFICDLIIYDQSWTKIREVTKIECNPGDNNRKKRGLVGGWKTVNVTDPFIKNVTSFSMKSVGESISAPNVKLVEIKSAETQVVSGQNVKLKLKVKDDDKGIFICDLIIYDQSWTKIREVTKIECNPGDNNRKKRGLVGGWKTVNVTDPFIKNVTSFSMKSVGESISAPNVKLVEIKSAETQIVSGQNIKLKLKVKDDDKGIFICDLIIYDQSWTKIREVTKIECNPGDNNRKKRGLVGGWKTVNVTDPFIKNVTSFSMKSVGESISAPNVKLVEIKSAETQVVSGQNVKLKLKVKDDDKGIFICDLIIYDQSWTKIREVTKIECNPGDNNRKKRGLVGGWKTVNVTDPFIKNVTSFSMKSVGESISAPNVKLVEIKSAETQIVSGQNIKLKLKVKDDDKGIFICDLIIYDQSWTKIREVTKIECNPGDNNRKKRGLVGGWKTVNVTDPFIKNVTSFSMKSVGESISAPNVKLVEIKSAETQIVSGQNIKLKLKVKDDDKGIFICDLIIYDQSWTKIREVTKIECNPGDNNRKKRSLVVGGYALISDQKAIAKYTALSLSQIANNKVVNSQSGVTLVKVNHAESQVVAGLNIRLDLTVKDSNNGFFTCVVVIWEQSWKNFAEVTDVNCQPGDGSTQKP